MTDSPSERDLQEPEQVPGISLARRPDFQLGDAVVKPSIRTVEGPGASATIEPRGMQVLLALVDAGGAVLTREDLIRLCWNGTIVGDDSVNRAISEVRRVARATAAGFSVETIPRIGYRLSGAIPADPAPLLPATEPAGAIAGANRQATRRWVVAGGLAAAIGGLGAWAAAQRRTDPRFADLIERGKQLRLDTLPESDVRAAELFRQATVIDPDSAVAWGLLAVASNRVGENAAARETAAAVRTSEQAARRALELDPNEPNALWAMAMLRFSLDDWVETERKLLDIAAIAPDNAPTLHSLTYFLQAVGRNRDSWYWNERAVALEPLSPGPQWRRALKHWILGRPTEAVRVIDRAIDLWPEHPWVWNARLVILAFTDRPRAALGMIEEDKASPRMLTPEAAATWRASLTALDTRTARDIAAAREANLAAAPRGAGLAAYGSMVLSALGEVDAAYAIMTGFLLRRGPLVGAERAAAVTALTNDPGWRRTQWLFCPATDAVRADPRFGALCEEIGLARYWRHRGVAPDYLRYASQA